MQLPDKKRRKMIQTKKLAEIAEIESIYRTRMKEDFAPDELRPLSAIVQAWEKGIYDCYVLTDRKAILGYACFVRKDNSYLLDYLAISSEHRGEGWEGDVFRPLCPSKGGSHHHLGLQRRLLAEGPLGLRAGGQQRKAFLPHAAKADPRNLGDA